MRILKLITGICVLLVTLHFTHAIHRFLVHSPPAHTASFMAGIPVAILVGVLSFIGGCLLLRAAR